MGPQPDVLMRLQAALADRYTVERELGRGGMATMTAWMVRFGAPPRLLLALLLGCGEATAPGSWTPSMDGRWVADDPTTGGAFLKTRYFPGSELGGGLTFTPVVLEVATPDWQLTSTGGPQPWCDPDCAWAVAGTVSYASLCGTNIEEEQCVPDVTFRRGTEVHDPLVILRREVATQPPREYLTIQVSDTAGIGYALRLFGIPVPDFTIDGVWCCAEHDVVGLTLVLQKR